MKKIIRIDEAGWARCGECGHKLFKTNVLKDSYGEVKFHHNLRNIGFELKCHSCKTINTAER